MTEITFAELCRRSTLFSKQVPFPTEHNRIAKIGKDNVERQKQIEAHAKGTRVITSPNVLSLIDKFLKVKKEHGTAKEQQLYTQVVASRTDFLDRVLKKRPMVFMGSSDLFVLKNGVKGHGGFDEIGTNQENPDLKIGDYMTYDEMAISALVGVSVPTHFVNNGNRFNAAKPDGKHEDRGILVGLVGARFERDGMRPQMESKHILVSSYCTEERGYGAQGAREHPDPVLQLWADFYGLPHFPSLAEVQKMKTIGELDTNFLDAGKSTFFNVDVFKKRMRHSIEPFLLDANDRAIKERKRAYCHIVGLGLGVWMFTPKQGKLLVDVFDTILKERKLAAISDLDFSYFPDDCTQLGGVCDNGVYKQNGNLISVHFSKRNPADPLNDAQKLLVAMYAWDGNAYPGNEYWMGSLVASGDPAAACCSTIPELQNPEINPYVCGANVWTGQQQ